MKTLLYISGFILTLIGLITNILYINLLYFGYTLNEYIKYSLNNYSFIYLILGVFMISISIFIKGDKNAKNIWYIIKL